MVIFHSYVTVYQRVTNIYQTIKLDCVQGTIYRKQWILAWNTGGSCKLSYTNPFTGWKAKSNTETFGWSSAQLQLKVLSFRWENGAIYLWQKWTISGCFFPCFFPNNTRPIRKNCPMSSNWICDEWIRGWWTHCGGKIHPIPGLVNLRKSELERSTRFNR